LRIAALFNLGFEETLRLVAGLACRPAPCG